MLNWHADIDSRLLLFISHLLDEWIDFFAALVNSIVQRNEFSLTQLMLLLIMIIIKISI